MGSAELLRGLVPWASEASPEGGCQGNLRAASQDPASSFASCPPPSLPLLPPVLATKMGSRAMTSSLQIRARCLVMHFWKPFLFPQASESPSRPEGRQQEWANSQRGGKT